MSVLCQKWASTNVPFFFVFRFLSSIIFCKKSEEIYFLLEVGSSGVGVSSGVEGRAKKVETFLYFL